MTIVDNCQEIINPLNTFLVYNLCDCTKYFLKDYLFFVLL